MWFNVHVDDANPDNVYERAYFPCAHEYVYVSDSSLHLQDEYDHDDYHHDYEYEYAPSLCDNGNDRAMLYL